MLVFHNGWCSRRPVRSVLYLRNWTGEQAYFLLVHEVLVRGGKDSAVPKMGPCNAIQRRLEIVPVSCHCACAIASYCCH